MKIEEKIAAFIRDDLIQDTSIEWDRGTDVVSTGLLDSLSIVKLMVFVEDTFDISIDDAEDLEEFKTVESIASLVSRKQKDGGECVN